MVKYRYCTKIRFRTSSGACSRYWSFLSARYSVWVRALSAIRQNSSFKAWIDCCSTETAFLPRVGFAPNGESYRVALKSRKASSRLLLHGAWSREWTSVFRFADYTLPQGAGLIQSPRGDLERRSVRRVPSRAGYTD